METQKQLFKVPEKMIEKVRESYYAATEEERKSMIHPDDAVNDPYLYVAHQLGEICMNLCKKDRKLAAEKYQMTRDLVFNGHNPFRDTVLAKMNINVEGWKNAIKIIRLKEQKPKQMGLA
ncbi:hypothetical protein [Bdellovibrio sp. BCCA]|uniref:hypothetical protein n=1 Tax=Bdellovibrio sp. BCCA TaxID=3136281 RepID=UPI0030F1C8F4